MNSKNQLKKRRKYDEDFKAEVLKMIENGQSISTISQSLGIGENLIYRWKSKHKNKVKAAVKGEKSDFSLKLLEENEVLKEKVKQLETERDILKKSLVHFQPPDLRLSYELIAVLEADFKVETLCQLLQVSRSGYYRYRKGESFQVSESKKKQAGEVKRVFDEHKRRYGSRRILAELKDLHLQVGRHRVRVLMQEAYLKAIQPKRFVPKTTDSSHGKKACPNLLLNEQGKFIGLPTAPNRIWVSDITYIPLTSGKFVYLGVWLDLFSRMLVGWRLDENMEESLLISGLDKALKSRKPMPGLIVHSDRGGQYFSKKMRKLLEKYHCRQSMSRRDEVYDNSYAESFFSRFKTELMEEGAFLSIEDARTEIFEFIEIYYNRKRRHSALGNKIPLNYEKLYYLQLP